MIFINKKSNIIYLENHTNLCLDADFKPAKPSKNDLIISPIGIKELSRFQISIPKSQSLQIPNIRDYLYARCIQEKFFLLQNHYIFTYILEDGVSDCLYHIYAKELQESQKNSLDKDFLIPDIFLPLALENKHRELNLFLFGENLVFYYEGKLTYQTSVSDVASLSKALHYIETIYSKLPLFLYCDNEKFLTNDIPIPAGCLGDLTSSDYPIARLCFDYIQKCTSEDLPLLDNTKKSAMKSKTLSMLLKIAVVVILMLLFPIGKIGYGFYLDYQLAKLQLQNDKVLEAIKSSNKHQSKAFLNTQAQNEFLQHHLQSLQKIQTSYIPRYNIIAEISRRLEGRGISVENFYFTSDITEDVQVLELELKSLSQTSLIDFLQNLSSIPITSVISNSVAKNEKIFSNGIFRQKDALVTKIVWISNVL